MRCIIVGYGRVGRQTASTLHDEGHDVAIVDSDRERVEAGDSVGVVVDPERLPEVRSALRECSAAG
jgi:trk system potassium uptake protein TrkA